MTPIEKAETALNRRIERLQLALGEAKSDAARQFLVQSLIVTIGLGEALTGYVRMVGEFAQRRHAGLKQAHDRLTAEHATLLNSGRELLERLKADPTDRAIRKEIDDLQRSMATIQKTLKRGANSLQRDVAPATAMIDQLALTLRRLADAEDGEALKRATRAMVEHVRELCHAHPDLPAKDIVDAEGWAALAATEIEQATDSREAYARAGFHAMLALEIMTLAVSATPPATAEAAAGSGREAVAARFKAITARFTPSEGRN